MTIPVLAGVRRTEQGRGPEKMCGGKRAANLVCRGLCGRLRQGLRGGAVVMRRGEGYYTVSRFSVVSAISVGPKEPCCTVDGCACNVHTIPCLLL